MRRAYLGIAGGPRPLPPNLRDRYEQRSCVEVVDVIEASAAERAGLRRGDLIVSIDGQPVQSAGDLQRLMTAERIGSALAVEYVREAPSRPWPQGRTSSATQTQPEREATWRRTWGLDPARRGLTPGRGASTPGSRVGSTRRFLVIGRRPSDGRAVHCDDLDATLVERLPHA